MTSSSCTRALTFADFCQPPDHNTTSLSPRRVSARHAVHGVGGARGGMGGVEGGGLGTGVGVGSGGDMVEEMLSVGWGVSGTGRDRGDSRGGRGHGPAVFNAWGLNTM